MTHFIDLSLLSRNRNYRLMFIGQFISYFGTMITATAMPYQIYHQTNSTLMVGLLSLAQLLPLLITALLGGVLADHYDRRKILIMAGILLAIASFALTINAFLATPHIWLIFVIASFMSALNGLYRPSSEGLAQQIVEKKDYSIIASLKMLNGNICMIGGPLIAGLIIAYTNLAITYLIDFISFLVALISLSLMQHIPSVEIKKREPILISLKQGFQYAASRQELIGTYLVDFVAMVFGMPMALFPAIAQTYFSGAKVLGMLYAAPAVGAVLSSFVSGWTKRIQRQGVAIAIAASIWGIAIILFGIFRHHLLLTLFFLACAGAADAISSIFRLTLWNESIPSHLRGRLSSLEIISYLSGPRLGDAEAGLVAAAFGIPFSIISGGILCIVSVAACCYWLPKFWHYQSDMKTPIDANLEQK